MRPEPAGPAPAVRVDSAARQRALEASEHLADGLAGARRRLLQVEPARWAERRSGALASAGAAGART